ncbi:MAG: CBS domain-containing protein [Nitrososphaeraceae archaeon]
MTSERKIHELSLEELFPQTLFETESITVDKNTELWIVGEMCAQYLESAIDALLVTENNAPVGIIGGYEILSYLRKNPTRNAYLEHKIDKIFFKPVPQINKKIKLFELIENWRSTRRAFSVIHNGTNDYFSISARKMLEIGKQFRSGVYISDIPKKKSITFNGDENVGEILDLMFKNGTRRILLENSNQFISYRIIIAKISMISKFHDLDYFLDIPINQFEFEYGKEIKSDLSLSQICLIMDKMDHPCLLYQNSIITAWDICLILLSDKLTEYSGKNYSQKKTCPHCGKEID